VPFEFGVVASDTGPKSPVSSSLQFSRMTFMALVSMFALELSGKNAHPPATRNPQWSQALEDSQRLHRIVVTSVEDTNMTPDFWAYKEPLAPSHSESMHPTHSRPIYVSTTCL